MNLGRRLIEAADQIIASGSIPAKLADFLSRVLSEAGVTAFSDPLGTVRFPAPEVIWQAWKMPASKEWGYIERFVEVITEPGEALEIPLVTGDILVRVALGEPGLGHLALIADPRLWRREELAGAGLTPEGRRPGKYVQVVEGGGRPHSQWEGFARRLTDTEGRLPNTQMILRLILNMASELTEQVTTSPVTNGEFGMALNKYGEMPNGVIDLLKLSPIFVTMATNLDSLYVDIWNPARASHRLDVVRNFSDGVVTLGTSRRRVLNIESSFTTDSWFQPFSISGPGIYDAIYFQKIGSAEIGKWIEVIAHETAHAFRFANGQISRPKITCPQPKTVQADSIRESIKDEILARQIEARVLREIQANPGGTLVSNHQPTTGSTDQKLVERDFLTAFWNGTYLEHFVLETLVQEVIVCDKLNEKTIKDKNFNVGRIPLAKRKLEEYLKDQDYIDPDSGKLTKFATRYARLRFIQRIIDARWQEFKKQHSPADKDFDQAKEKILQEHAAAFFQGIINYTPLKKP